MPFRFKVKVVSRVYVQFLWILFFIMYMIKGKLFSLDSMINENGVEDSTHEST